MENVYLACLILGIVFPLLSLVFDVFDDVLDAIFSGIEFLDMNGAISVKVICSRQAIHFVSPANNFSLSLVDNRYH